MNAAARDVGDIYDPKTIQPSTSIGYLLNRVRAELLYAIDQELAPSDITAAQYVIMAQLAFSLAGSTSALCKGMAYDPGAMTRMIDRLEAKKFIRRVRDPQDRRSVGLELTDEGRKAFPEMKERVVRVLNRFLRGFTKAEARQLENLLQRMLANA
jgi:DNA-binding MarR family transcriptional regulator